MLIYEYYYQRWIYSSWEKVFAAQKWCSETHLWLMDFETESEAIAYMRSS